MIALILALLLEATWPTPKPDDTPEIATMLGLALIGLTQLALHPRKTYALMMHGRGWYG
jgi:hypothetical protein